MRLRLCSGVVWCQRRPSTLRRLQCSSNPLDTVPYPTLLPLSDAGFHRWRKHRVQPKSSLYKNHWRQAERSSGISYGQVAVRQQQQDMAAASAISRIYGLPDISPGGGRAVAGGSVAPAGGRAGWYEAQTRQDEQRRFERGLNWDQHDGQTFSVPELNARTRAGGSGLEYVVSGPGERLVDEYVRCGWIESQA